MPPGDATMIAPHKLRIPIMKNLRISITLFIALSTSFGYAQAQMMQQLETRFVNADKNHDGKLTLAEAQAGMPRMAVYFDQIDSTHSGAITLDQIKAFIVQQQH
jgi:hypothetical protein